MTKNFLVFTPVNPTRPHHERLNILHRYNVHQNHGAAFDYVEKQVRLPATQQAIPVLRGRHVIEVFNEVYKKNKGKYRYICKWDDDVILPRNILNMCRKTFDDDPETKGVGLFQETYGAPNILMANPMSEGWYGAFSRFYCYDMKVWGEIPLEYHGDPDNAFQVGLNVKKQVLDVPSIHLDHRCMTEKQYKVALDIASFIVMCIYKEQPV